MELLSSDDNSLTITVNLGPGKAPKTKTIDVKSVEKIKELFTNADCITTVHMTNDFVHSFTNAINWCNHFDLM